jgi:CRISPR-associated protein Cas5h
MSEVLAFDVWGQYGHFRKIYTTTSPLTYSIPPRTAVTGLIGAILGLDKTEYIRHFTKQDAEIAIRLLNPVKKVTLSENLIDTKKAGAMMNVIRQRTQIRIELLKDPKFRIYVRHSDRELMEKLTEYLEGHRSVYTPCLGLSEHIANFQLTVIHESEEASCEEKIHAVTAVPEDKIKEIEFEKELEYVQENMPNEMNPNRVVTEYSSVILEQRTRPIKALVSDAVRLDSGEFIVFL